MIPTINKAISAGVFMLAGTLGGLMADGDVTTAEAIIALGAGLVAGAATYRVPYYRRVEEEAPLGRHRGD